ncbi:ribosome biogenesis GTPase Der [Enterovirga aerilata]|uniref:GTPase Der n=1 Tax=Enterovirga aerilata TaxID=2730920 RepID=A0A849I4J8_9HYPH|nr:ribosome biogenesis GTPase Der [Enterovirga sp. DB1703]NNM72251.1 ribosome biogenesis GTPase Der [Enterovirga sp. DB1703]
MRTVAIIGRPNVGKSTLFNRLVGQKLALVDDRPGVTRDRREGEAELGHLSFRIIDTAGLEEAEPGSLSDRMRRQTEAAIDEADLVLFLVDARAGILPADETFAELVRRSGKPVVLLANKAEGRGGMAGAYDAFSLGLGDPVPLSAEHGEGMGDLLEAIEPFLETGEDEDDEDRAGKPLRVAIVGRPNAGKSTLVNRMIGAERLLTGPEAGITRDTISVDWRWRDHPIRLFDTAGLRKRARVEDKLEKLSVADALRAIRFAEVVVVLLDATIPFEKQDLSIVDLIESEGRAIVIGLNKWDLVADRPGLLKELRADAERLLPQVRGAPVVPLSGLAGEGIDRLMGSVVQAAEVWSRRVPTAKLNDWLAAALSAHPPPAVSGRRIKIRYMTQVKARPPHFALFGNQLDALPRAYTRYLVNGLRETFELPGVPIRLSLRSGKNPFEGKKKTWD